MIEIQNQTVGDFLHSFVDPGVRSDVTNRLVERLRRELAQASGGTDEARQRRILQLCGKIALLNKDCRDTLHKLENFLKFDPSDPHHHQIWGGYRDY